MVLHISHFTYCTVWLCYASVCLFLFIRIMFTVSDESFTSDPVFVTLDIVLANDNAPVVIASPLGQVSHPGALHSHLLQNTDIDTD